MFALAALWALLGSTSDARGPGHPGAAIPLYDLSAPCDDRRYPQLAGPWVVGCGPGGVVDRALSLETGVLHHLPSPATAPALDDGQVYLPGADGGRLRLTPTAVHRDETGVRLRDPLAAPPALRDDAIVVLAEDAVLVARVGDPLRRRYPSSPQGWYPPAIAGDRVAWIEAGERLWWMTLDKGHPEAMPVAGPNARHVVASGPYLSWVEPDRLVQMDVRTADVQVFPVRTGFSAPPSAWGAVLCWEQWGEVDLDVRCSDGLQVQRPGHQQWPSRWEKWLLFREAGIVWLMTAPGS